MTIPGISTRIQANWCGNQTIKVGEALVFCSVWFGCIIRVSEAQQDDLESEVRHG